jgi:hypothetical protein
VGNHKQIIAGWEERVSSLQLEAGTQPIETDELAKDLAFFKLAFFEVSRFFILAGLRYSEKAHQTRH